MAKGQVRKRCVECKRVMNGTAGKAQWCDCGGEMVAVIYRRPVRRRSGKH